MTAGNSSREPMKFKLLGGSGLRVSELCLGTMTFGNERSWGANEAESRAVFDRFVDAGGNFFDTANVYQGGESEEMLGRFIARERDRYVVATKFSLAAPDDADPNIRGNTRKALTRSLDASLKRMATDHVDLFWVHAWDGHTQEEELLRALEDVVRSGKAFALGLSDTPAWICARMQTIAELRGWTMISAAQFTYSLIERSAEREVIPMAGDMGMAMTIWGGLGGGMLTGKYERNAMNAGRLGIAAMAGGRLNDRNFVIVDAVKSIAESLNATASQVALAWLRHQSPAIIPIIGARTVEQLADNLGCLEIALSDEAITALDMVSEIHQGFPREFLMRGAVTTLLYGAEDRVDAPRRA